MARLPKTYDAPDVESRWYERWVKDGRFGPEASSGAERYVIMIPPPNITGILHMGHILNNGLQDILIRWQRLKGREVLWLPGTDHAGIATQNKVKAQLRSEDVDMEALGRAAFVDRCWEWRNQFGGTITKQLRRLGCSLDWDRERFTLDEGLSRAVREVFVRLYKEGLIYRGDYLVNWCPECGSALSDEEVEHREAKGNLWYLNYPRADGEGHVTVATTRPETMLGDTAVAVHPGDERYRDLIGKTVRLPIVERKVPVIADEWVDPEFGTGAVKVTPGHDPNDFEIGKRHGLTIISILDARGRTTEAAGPLAGLSREAARDEVVRRFDEAGLLVKKTEHTHAIGHCYRDKTVVEPTVSRQWFVRMEPLAQPAIDAVRDGRVRFYPERWTKTYFNWMENIRDWCISRQLWWGHRIPIWYCTGCGEEHLEEETTRCKSCGAESFEQDPDVLDTWFSSWLWPFSTLGWPEETDDLAAYYPGNTLVTGPDIIFFWVARMIMAGLKFRGDVPFREVYLHGIVRDDTGRKMEKTLGNSPDPLDVIAKYGADALRFTMIYLTPKDGDVAFAEKKVETGLFFANKVWQVSRFVLMNVGGTRPDPSPVPRGSGADRWIRSRFAAVSNEVDAYLGRYEFSEAAHLLYDFIWHEYCDWYVEMSKVHLRSDDAEEQRAARITLLEILESLLRLLHPFMPFLTEEIWSFIPGRDDSIMAESWPAVGKASDAAIDERMKVVQSVITAVRNIRSETNVGHRKEVRISLRTPAEVAGLLEEARPYMSLLAKASSIEIGPEIEPPAPSSAAVADGVEVFVHLEGLVDLESERARLSKELEKVNNLYQSAFNKLNNSDFLERAPKDVIERERRRLENLESDREKLSRNLAVLTGTSEGEDS